MRWLAYTFLLGWFLYILLDWFCSFLTFNLVICKDSLLWQLDFPNDIGFSVDITNRSTDLEAREIWEYALRFDLGVLRSVHLEALDCVQLFLRRHRGHLQRSPKLPHPAQLVGLDHTFIEKYLFIICTLKMPYTKTEWSYLWSILYRLIIGYSL